MIGGDRAAQHHEHTWDWDYEGMVWMRIAPTTGQPHHLYPSLFWGPWMRPTKCPAVLGEGVVLFTSKGLDKPGKAAPFHLLSNHRITVSFGDESNVPEADAYYDINGIWSRPADFDQKARAKGIFWFEPDVRSYCYHNVRRPEA
jgi:hypothetical protein